jgi:hypothetical protein
MRSTCRAFLSAILLTALAGVAVAQDPGTAPPPSASPVVKPDALPPLPTARSMPALAPAVAPDVQPALTMDPTAQMPPAAAPVASVAVVPPASKKPIAKTATHVTKKSVRKPETKPAVETSPSFESVTTATTATTADVPPPAAAASTALLEAVKPPPPAANAAVAETPSDATKSQTTMGVGGWILFGIALVLVFSGITVFRRRRARANVQPSILGFADSTRELAPVLVPRR